MASTKQPGVSLSVRWGEHELTREFLALNATRTYTVGTGAGVDFACPGAKSLALVEVDADGASLHGVALERGQVQEVVVGGLTFEAQLLDAPPRVKAKPAEGELAALNVGIVLLALFGVFAVAAANAAAEGFAMDDELSGASPRAVKMLVRREEQRKQSAASAVAEAARKMNKDPKGPPKSPNHQARKLPIERPTGKPSKVDVGNLFKGPGLGAVFASSGLGEELKVASTGMLTAQQGTGVGLMGTGHGMDGNGLGGMGLQGIGAMGTKGGRGKDGFGAGPMLAKKAGPELPEPEGGLVTCETTGNGCLDKDLIRRVIRANLAGFRYCYESQLNKAPTLEGKVSVKFSIAQSGRVPTSTVASSTANNSELESCVAGRVRLLQFPASKWSGLVLVTYPFIFKQSGSR